MPTTNNPTDQPTPKPRSKVIRFSQTLDRNIYDRVTKAKEKKGLQSEQDIIRLATVYFLDASGF